MIFEDDFCPEENTDTGADAGMTIELDPGTRERRQLPGYDRDFLRNKLGRMWCDVVPLSPRLCVGWKYRGNAGLVWECTAVWLHSAALPNGSVYTSSLYIDLRDAINRIARDKDSDAVRYSLLVRPDGMEYDRARLGGDLHVAAPSGRQFTFSVRRDGTRKLLLAIAWT